MCVIVRPVHSVIGTCVSSMIRFALDGLADVKAKEWKRVDSRTKTKSSECKRDRIAPVLYCQKSLLEPPGVRRFFLVNNKCVCVPPAPPSIIVLLL